MSAIKIQYEVSGTSPLTYESYISEDINNPNVIALDESVTLNFGADGVYFLLVPTKSKVLISNASIVSWTCKSPYTSGSLVINSVINPDEDVVVTIPIKVKVIPQIVTKPYLLQTSTPIDTRLVLSKKQMIEVKDNYQPELYFALCKDDGHFYLYDKSASPNLETGKFTLITDSIKKTLKNIDGGEIV